MESKRFQWISSDIEGFQKNFNGIQEMLWISSGTLRHINYIKYIRNFQGFQEISRDFMGIQGILGDFKVFQGI